MPLSGFISRLPTQKSKSGTNRDARLSVVPKIEHPSTVTTSIPATTRNQPQRLDSRVSPQVSTQNAAFYTTGATDQAKATSRRSSVGNSRRLSQGFGSSSQVNLLLPGNGGPGKESPFVIYSRSNGATVNVKLATSAPSTITADAVMQSGTYRVVFHQSLFSIEKQQIPAWDLSDGRIRLHEVYAEQVGASLDRNLARGYPIDYHIDGNYLTDNADSSVLTPFYPELGAFGHPISLIPFVGPAGCGKTTLFCGQPTIPHSQSISLLEQYLDHLQNQPNTTPIFCMLEVRNDGGVFDLVQNRHRYNGSKVEIQVGSTGWTTDASWYSFLPADGGVDAGMDHLERMRMKIRDGLSRREEIASKTSKGIGSSTLILMIDVYHGNPGLFKIDATRSKWVRVAKDSQNEHCGPKFWSYTTGSGKYTSMVFIDVSGTRRSQKPNHGASSVHASRERTTNMASSCILPSFHAAKSRSSTRELARLIQGCDTPQIGQILYPQLTSSPQVAVIALLSPSSAQSDVLRSQAVINNADLRVREDLVVELQNEVSDLKDRLFMSKDAMAEKDARIKALEEISQGHSDQVSMLRDQMSQGANRELQVEYDNLVAACGDLLGMLPEDGSHLELCREDVLHALGYSTSEDA